MSSIVDKYKHVWGAKPRILLSEYTYQPELTRKLDMLQPSDLNSEIFYEIILWKLNRFPKLESDLIGSLKEIAGLKPKEHRKAMSQLRALLRCPGIALPMASTVLRFLNPDVFQIIDDRVYRIVLSGKAKYPTKPTRVTENYLATSAMIYFDYLDALHEQCCAELPFSEADRILYQLDKKLGNKIGD
ncbi:MAG: hypothetical protein AB7D06_01560 [Pedobacter sp.]